MIIEEVEVRSLTSGCWVGSFSDCRIMFHLVSAWEKLNSRPIRNDDFLFYSPYVPLQVY